MKSKENHQENTDYFGDKWNLAPGGRKIIDKNHRRTWRLQLELKGYAALFRNLGTCELGPDELYGVSLGLENIAKRLGKISDELPKAMIQENQ